MENKFSLSSIDRKIAFWRKLSIISGLISPLSLLITFIISNLLAHQDSLLVLLILGNLIQSVLIFSYMATIIAFVKITILSAQRKKSLPRDYIIAAIGIVLAFSPYIIGKILSLFGIL